MYFDLDGPIRSATGPPPAFRVDYLTGGDAALGCVQGAAAVPLCQAYFCDGCSHVVSKADLQEDVDSYFCPNCLENMPSSEATVFMMRCSKCWECPVCFSTALTCHGGENLFYIACGHCRWNTRGLIEASVPEQLVPKVINLERDTHIRLKTALLVDAFRMRAQEHHKEKENAQRARRRSSFARSSFAVGVLGGLTNKRISSNIGAFAKGRAGSGPGMGGSMLRPVGEGDEGNEQGPQWRMEDLQAKLQEQILRTQDIRAPARFAAEERKKQQEQEKAADASPASSGGLLSPTKLSPQAPRGSTMSTHSHLSTGTTAVKAPEMLEAQVLQGFSVDELLKAHVEGLERPQSGGHGGQNAQLPKMHKPLNRLQQSIDADGEQMGSITTLAQRLPLGAYGYQDIVPSRADNSVEMTPMKAHEHGQLNAMLQGGVRMASAQLDAPLWHADSWALPPVRKLLLTKRSRRCRLLILQSQSGKADPGAPRRQCKSIVVKPQINPCANPPYQKNNIAVNFVPRLYPWAWRGASGCGEGGVSKMSKPSATSAAAALAAVRGGAVRPSLKPGEAAELVFGVVNPVDKEMEVHFDTTFANKSIQKGDSFDPEVESIASFYAEQNVEVLTQPFTCILTKLDDLAEVQEAANPEDQKRIDELKEKDDKDVIVDRRFHKALIRIRVKAHEGEGDSIGPWVFFLTLTWDFKDNFNKMHKAKAVMRIGCEASKVVAPAPGVLAERFPAKVKFVTQVQGDEWAAARASVLQSDDASPAAAVPVISVETVPEEGPAVVPPVMSITVEAPAEVAAAAAPAPAA